MIERMLMDFDHAHYLRSISLRYFNAAGADPGGEIGEMHDPETHLIPLILKVAAGICPSITVYGNDYVTPDGTCIRDYIHVTDLANAHVLALQALEAGAKSTAYNLGNGQGFSVHEVIASAATVTGKIIPVMVGQRRVGDPPILIGDATRAIAELRWKPLLYKLPEIMATAWSWHCVNRTFGD